MLDFITFTQTAVEPPGPAHQVPHGSVCCSKLEQVTAASYSQEVKACLPTDAL